MHGVSYYTQLTLNFVDVVSFVDYLGEHFVSEGNFSVNDTSYTCFYTIQGGSMKFSFPLFFAEVPKIHPVQRYQSLVIYFQKLV